MRIVGGTWRGRALQAPSGRDVTRPTTDRMRESFASMLLSAFDLDLSEVSVLDAFAGSGALGLEMLSRGAAHATFVEMDRGALACVQANLRTLGVERNRAAVVKGDVFKLARRAQVAGVPFTLVLLDPPYATEAERVSALVRELQETGLLATGAVVLYERAREADGLDVEGTLLSTREHGVTAVDLLRLGSIDR